MVRNVGAVIPAAGQGMRLGGPTSKAFITLAGQPLILHPLKALEVTPAIRWIVVAVRRADRAAMQRLVRRHRLTKVTALVIGGSTRAQSVIRGMAALPAKAQWVLVHDGARPCLTRRLIQATIAQARRYGAVACGLPASVTVKAVDQAATVRLTLDRDSLWFMQTPQVFRRDWLAETLARVDHHLETMPDDPTTRRSAQRADRSAFGGCDGWWDDAALLEWAGFPVHVVPGDPLNIKVTTREDLLLAEAILKRRYQRTDGRGQKSE